MGKARTLATVALGVSAAGAGAAVIAAFRKQLVDGFFPASARHLGLAHDIRTTTPIAPDLPIEQLRMPVLLVGTADDPYNTGEVVRYAAGRLPTATALILETGGHILIGQQDQIRQAIQGFLGAQATQAKQVLR
jgi:pimeloyl-ACP methyl ester carboxylesterase